MGTLLSSLQGIQAREHEICILQHLQLSPWNKLSFHSLITPERGWRVGRRSINCAKNVINRKINIEGFYWGRKGPWLNGCRTHRQVGTLSKSSPGSAPHPWPLQALQCSPSLPNKRNPLVRILPRSWTRTEMEAGKKRAISHRKEWLVLIVHPIPEDKPCGAMQPQGLGSRILLEHQGCKQPGTAKVDIFPFFLPALLMLSAEFLFDSSFHKSVHPGAACQGWLETTKFSSKELPRQLLWKLHKDNLIWEAGKVKTAERTRSQLMQRWRGHCFSSLSPMSASPYSELP